jgi:predicted deacylase
MAALRTTSWVARGGRGADLPVVTIGAGGRGRGPARGPVVVVTANVHGDECTGLGAALRLAPLLEERLRRGVVHLYPTLNPEGLERRTRRVPHDDQDLNRLFPGDADGSPAERLAHAAWVDIASRMPTLLVDLHADAIGAMPYALLDRAVCRTGKERADLEGRVAELAEATGLTVLWEYPDERYSRYRLDRSLTGAAMNRLGCPAVTIEAGPRLSLDEAAVGTTVDAVLGILHGLRMVDDRPAPARSRVGGGPWRRDSGPRASVAGVLFPGVAVGRPVAGGDVVARVHGFDGALLEAVRADADGFVVSAAERAHVVPGVPVCTYATRESRP